jgi:hypothetical protein
MAQAVLRRAVNAEARVRFNSIIMRYVVDKMALGQVVPPPPPVLRLNLISVIPPMIHTRLHLNVALTRRTNGRNVGTFQVQW